MFTFFQRKAGVKSTGKTSGKSNRSASPKGWWRAPLQWLRYAVLGFFATSVLATLFFRFVPPPLTPLMAIRCARQISSAAPLRLDKSWRPLERISPRLAEAVIASEDQRFFDHNGFDWGAIGSAFTRNGRSKRKLGASTISQQTAKNLFLWPDRTWVRKGLEAYFTLLMETLWSKRRILEVYLNIIETGEGAYGAEAAAGRYFQVTAAELTSGQAALLAAILPNPRVWSPVAPTAYLARRQAWILRQMDHLGPMPEGLSEGGPRSPRTAPLPGQAPSLGSLHDTLGPVGPSLPPEDSEPLPSPEDLLPAPVRGDAAPAPMTPAGPAASWAPYPEVHVTPPGPNVPEASPAPDSAASAPQSP